VVHIPQFGDAASPTGDVDVSAGDAHFQWETTTSQERDAASPTGDAVYPEGDLLASPNFGICDTTHITTVFLGSIWPSGLTMWEGMGWASPSHFSRCVWEIFE
jgi:hypothetical protein